MRKKVTLLGVGIPIGIIVLVMVVTFMGLGFRYFIAPYVGIIEQQEIVHTGEFRIFSYDHFFSQCAAIQSAEAMCDGQIAILEGMAVDDENHYKQQTIVAAQRAFIAELTYKYNTDVDKEGTRGQFKAECLPDYIDATPHKKGERTECDCY